MKSLALALAIVLAFAGPAASAGLIETPALAGVSFFIRACTAASVPRNTTGEKFSE